MESDMSLVATRLTTTRILVVLQFLATAACIEPPLAASSHSIRFAHASLKGTYSTSGGAVATNPFYVKLDNLAVTARATGDNRDFAQQSLLLLGLGDADATTSKLLIDHLRQAEDRQRRDLPPHVTEADIANTYNSICRDLTNIASCSPVSSEQVQSVRAFVQRRAPHLSVAAAPNCSPVESFVLLFLLIYNNGHIGSSTALPSHPQTSPLPPGTSGIQAKTGRLPMVTALQIYLTNMREPIRTAWIEGKLQQLHI